MSTPVRPKCRFLYCQTQFAKESFNLRQHIKKTAKILGLLVVWSLLLAVFGACLNGTELTLYSLWELFVDTKTGSLYTGPLWFLQALFALYLVFPLLKIAYDGAGKLFEYCFVVVCVFTIGLSALNMGVAIQEILLPNRDFGAEFFAWVNRLNPLGNGSFVMFFMLGGILKRYEDSLATHRGIWVASGLVSFLMSLVYCVSISYKTETLVNPGFNYASLFTPFILVGFYCLTRSFDGGRTYSLIKSVGSNTLGIYLIHMIFIWMISPLFAGAGLPVRVFELFLIFALCYITALALSKIPGIRSLLST